MSGGYILTVHLTRGDTSFSVSTNFGTTQNAARAFVQVRRAMHEGATVTAHGDVVGDSTVYRGEDIVLMQCTPPLTEQDVTSAEAWLAA